MTKKDQLFHTAKRLFVERGFHATPTSLIAEEAGVASGTLFYYFKTKEKLINDLYLDTKNKMLKYVMQGVEGERSVRSMIRRLWLNFLLWGLNETQDYQFVKAYSNSLYIDKLIREDAHTGFEPISQIINEGKRQEMIKNLDTQMLMNISLGTIFGTVDHLLEKNMYLEEDFTRDAFAVFWDGIKL